MKSIIFAGIAALAFPLSVSAGQLLPNLYAQTYCDSRDMGMSADNARKQAVDESYISSGNPRKVTYNGVKTTTDVVAAIRKTMKLCPQYF